MSDVSEWIIWSHKHNAWWLASRYGYTPYLSEAGRFTDGESREIAAKASLGRLGNGLPYSVRVPADADDLMGEIEQETNRVLAAKRGQL